MKIRVQVLIEFDHPENEEGTNPEVVEEVLCLQRGPLQAETLPLESEIGTTSLQRNVAEVAERLESEVSEDEPTIEGVLVNGRSYPTPRDPSLLGWTAVTSMLRSEEV